MTDVQLKDGDCPDCDGCGYLADDSDGTPWRAWLALPLNASAAVFSGLVKPEKCTKCGGTGDKLQVEVAPGQKAVIVFGLGAAESAAILWATEFLGVDEMSDLLNADDLYVDPERPKHGVRIWEGEVTTTYKADDLGIKEKTLSYRGKWRLPTNKEWTALRENRSPFDEYVKVGPVQTFAVLTDEMKAKGRWWVSWWGKVGFNLHMPWWITGGSEGEDRCICAAILANSVEEARAAVIGAHDDNGAGISEWRFVEHRSDDWQPFCDRFPRADWMQWPAEYER